MSLNLLLKYLSFLGIFAISLSVYGQVNVDVNGSIGSNEYGSHIEGNNQGTNGITWFNAWDSTNLYFGIGSSNSNESTVIYVDINPKIPVNGGSNADGTNVGFPYDRATYNPPFRADFVLYFKSGYYEFRKSNGSGGWDANVTTGLTYAQSGSGDGQSQEISIPWSAITGGTIPTSFNWHAFKIYNKGDSDNGIYGQIPAGNPGGAQNKSTYTLSANRYYTVSSTAIPGGTYPFNRISYSQPIGLTTNDFASASFYDFTVNPGTGFQLARSNSGGGWNIGGNLVVGSGNLYFGSGGSGYGSTTISNIIITGGNLNLDQTNKPLNLTGDLTIQTGGTLLLSGVIGGDLNIGGNWNKVGAFTSNNRAVAFNGTGTQTLTGVTTFDYLTLNNNLEVTPANDIIVNQKLTLAKDKTLTVNSSVKTFNVTNNGNIIVANNANFVQTGDFTAGTDSSFKVNRTTKPVLRLDYNSWSSPMKTSTQTLKQFSVGTLDNRFMTYTGGNFVAVADANATFTPGAGYLIRTQNTYSTTIPVAFHGQFVGTVPNSGNLTYTPTGITGQYVFLGNPYPSAISMSDFSTVNNGQMVADTFYVWNSEAKMIAGEYSGNNYVTHTAVGSNPSGSANFVPVGQGFFVDRGLTNSGNFTFNNTMRRTSETGTFAKSAVTDKFWLQMTTPSAAKPQLLVAFTPNASADYDAGYDGKMFDNSGDAIYSTVDSKSLIINALGTFNTNDVVNVTANFTAAGNYTLSIAQKEGLFENGQQIYLKDDVTGIETELTSADYAFAATAGLQADRFTVSFNKGVLASSNATKGQSTINTVNQVVYIKAASKIATVEVYDLSGKLIKTTRNVNTITTSFAVSYKGLAIVKLVLENGEVVTKKIILN